MNQLTKDSNTREVKFWNACSNFDETFLFFLFKTGASDKELYSQLQDVLHDEIKISNIEL